MNRLQQHQLVNKLGWVRDLAYDVTVDGAAKVQFEMGNFRLDRINVQLIPFNPSESVSTIQEFFDSLQPITFEDIPAYDVFCAAAKELINEARATLPKHQCLSSPIVWNNGAVVISIRPYPRYTYDIMTHPK